MNAPGWNRTINLGIKSPLLCQLSYGRNGFFETPEGGQGARDFGADQEG
jgi:hypothetical protein